jgi:hypothetical protein
VALAVLLAAPSLRGQTTFAAPSQPIVWKRYSAPDLCYAAVQRALMTEYNTERRDTMPYNPHDTLPTTVVTVAHQCLATQDIAQVKERSLPVLLQVALAANADSLVDSIIRRELALADSASQKAHARVVRGAYEALQAARPMRAAVAARWLAYADSAWPGAVLDRCFMHVQAASAALRQLDLAHFTEHATQAVAIAKRTPSEPLDSSEVQQLHLFTVLAEFALKRATMFTEGITDSVIAELAPLMGGMYGKTIPPLTGQFRFAGSASDQSVIPTPGQPSVLFFANPRCGAHCYPTYAILRRLRRTFPTLPILLAATTHGSFRNRPPPSGAQEAEYLRAYYQDELQLPFPLVVDTLPYTFRAAPDGRRVNGMPSIGGVAGTMGLDSGNLVVTDPKGRVVLQNVSLEDENVLVALIQLMLGART